MKKILFLITYLAFACALHAQLEVTSDGKVKIASSQTSYSTLLVGNNQYGENTSNVGITGSTVPMGGKNNIGVMGAVSANQSLSNEKNYGIFGVVNSMNNAHGRNYGLCGMVGFSSTPYGGAGLYATNYSYYYSYPTNIQGVYAGYFAGPVHITGNVTVPNMFIPSDSRLSENVVLLNERGGDTNTLDNLLAMNVLEYNMKSRIGDEIPDGIRQDETGEERKAYEYLKKDELKMSSRRHFGIDAEEIQKVYPDLVLEGQDGYLSVNYVELVPLLIRSIQELKQQVDELSGTGSRQTRAVAYQDDDLKTPTSANSGNVLLQNAPNPFREQTVIRFHLADDARDAHICIFDMTGKLLCKLPVTANMESITINGGELGEGLFLYSLVVGGQEIDTKRMLITK